MVRSLCILACLVGSTALAEEPPAKRQIESDLRLEMKLATGSEKLPAGKRPRIEARIVNRSKSQSYWVVEPGDGSEIGWREPYIYYTATVVGGDGERREVERLQRGRCGIFDNEWQKTVLEIPPGGELKLGEWLPQPEYLDFRMPVRVRMEMHYAYRAGESGKRPGPENAARRKPEEFGRMWGVPAFELVSQAVEFEVVSPEAGPKALEKIDKQ